MSLAVNSCCVHYAISLALRSPQQVGPSQTASWVAAPIITCGEHSTVKEFTTHLLEVHKLHNHLVAIRHLTACTLSIFEHLWAYSNFLGFSCPVLSAQFAHAK